MCRNFRGWNGQRWYRRQASQSQSSDVLFCRLVARILGRTADTLTTGRERSSSSSMKEGNAMNANTGTFAIALLTSVVATSTWAQELGRVHFQTSCTPQAQEKFDRGLALVHSFFYPDSVQAFTEAAAADPQCAIAYWGIAISHRPNPLVLPLAAAALKNGLEAVEKGKAIGAKT